MDCGLPYPVLGVIIDRLKVGEEIERLKEKVEK